MASPLKASTTSQQHHFGWRDGSRLRALAVLTQHPEGSQRQHDGLQLFLTLVLGELVPYPAQEHLGIGKLDSVLWGGVGGIRAPAKEDASFMVG